MSNLKARINKLITKQEESMGYYFAWVMSNETNDECRERLKIPSNAKNIVWVSGGFKYLEADDHQLTYPEYISSKKNST
jgi:hypothetical protein